MTSPNWPPIPTELNVVAEDQEADVNPFVGNESIDSRPSPLDLGGNILRGVGISQGSEKAEQKLPTNQAAKQVSGLIAGMFVTNKEPDSILFPPCNDMSVLEQSLEEMRHTALGLGYGPFPESVAGAWSRFVHETAENYRRAHQLGEGDLVPVKLTIPNWLSTNTSFDVLPQAMLMDIEVNSAVHGILGYAAKYCRITFNENVTKSARVGEYATRCTAIFKKNMTADRSFQGAENIAITIHGDQLGTIGTVTKSSIQAYGNFQGTFNTKGSGSSATNNVRVLAN